MKKDRDEAQKDLSLFQWALEKMTREKDRIQDELDKVRAYLITANTAREATESARATAEKRAYEAEQKLKELNDSFPDLEKKWKEEGIDSCADEMVDILNK